MTPTHAHLPQIASAGWFVDLFAPASAVGETVLSKLSKVDAAAARAQIFVYLFDGQRLSSQLDLLRASSSAEHRRLADALEAEDAIRRGKTAAARQLFARLDDSPPPLRAWAGLRELDALERLGKVDEAERGLTARRWEERDEPPLLGALVRARLFFRRGEAGAALEVLDAESHRCETAPKPLVAAYHRTLAIYLGVRGDFSRSLLHHRLALEAFRGLGDVFMLAKEYLSLGQSYQDGDELDHAEFFLRKASEVIEQFDNAPLAALLASRLGMLALARGELEQARDFFERDLAICSDASFRHGCAFARRNLGRVWTRLGAPETACELLATALADFVAMGDAFNEQLTRLDEASAMLARGVSAGVVERLDKVAEFFRRVDRAELMSQVEAVRARLYAANGKEQLAENEMAAATRGLLARRRPERAVESLVLFAEACVSKGDRRCAVEHLATAYREAVKAARPRLASTVLERLGAIDEQAVMDVADVRGGHEGKERPSSPEQFERYLLASHSPAAQEVVEEARRIAPTDETVLIEGETGVGKGILARFVHAASRRADATFVAVNCGAITETLLESELFGHEKGAFTGANARRVGIFETADGGTVFLDEIGELSPHAQVTLLRFLEDHQVRPVGSSTSRPVNIRLIAATNRDLLDEVRAGRFRQDLYYRLAVFPVRVPPLRERLADLPELVTFILVRNPEAQRKGIEKVSKGALKRLAGHEWAGNLRELDNVIRAAAIRCGGKQILERDLPSRFGETSTRVGIFPTLNDVVESHIAEALRLANGNQSKAAALLGVHRNTLGTKLRARKRG